MSTVTTSSAGESVGYLTPSPAITTTYTYDNLDRMTKVTHAAGTTTIAFANYSGFDNVGNRKKKTTSSGTESYVYDGLYRLLQTTSPKGTENFAYDTVGNRTSGPGAKDTAYQHNNGNQMTHGRVLGYDYDNMGNQYNRAKAGVSGKGWALNWDKENRLRSVVKTVGNEVSTVAFKYDPFGRRVEKSVTTTRDGTPETTRTSTWTYVYDADNVVLEIYKADSGGTTEEKTYYTHGAGVDEHLAMERSGQFYYFLADGLGSIVAITAGSGAVVQSYEYDSFGMVKPSTGFRNSYTYTGREWDKETGLYYYRARYYDPMEGRFIQKDPIGFNGGINVYAYTENNSVNDTDPYGLVKWTGVMYAGSIINKFGGGGYAFDLTSECVNNQSVFINVVAWGLGAGVGRKVVVGAGPISFEDDRSSLYPQGFVGTFRMLSAGYGKGVVAGWSWVQLGNSFSDVSLKPGLSLGIDQSFSGVWGRSYLWGPPVYRKCGCTVEVE